MVNQKTKKARILKRRSFGISFGDLRKVCYQERVFYSEIIDIDRKSIL